MKKQLLFLCFLLTFGWVSAQSFEIDPPSDYTLCSNDNGIVTIDLSTQTPQVLGTLNPSEYTVTYHESMAAAVAGTSPLPMIANFSNTQTLYVRVEKNGAPADFQVASFEVTINLPPMAVPPMNITVCDTPGVPSDGIALFDLNPLVPAIVGGQTGVIVSFHQTMTDAEVGVAPISNLYANNVPFSQTVYAHAENISTGCYRVIPIILQVNSICGGTCLAPNNLSISGVTMTSAVVAWNTPGGATQWEVVVTPPGTPAPTVGTPGIPVTTNPYVIAALNCSTAYTVYVRSVCGASVFSEWVGPFNFMTTNCSFAIGQPENLETCVSGNVACFDISQNESLILNGLNPAEYEFGYYATYADAMAGTNPFLTENNYCIEAFGDPQPVFVRVEKIATGDIAITSFTLSAQSQGCSGIRLNAFLDANSNGVRDGAEIAFPYGSFQYQINNDGVVHNVSFLSGSVLLSESNASNSYDIGYAISPLYAAQYSYSGTGYSDVTITPGEVTEYEFPVVATLPYADLSVGISALQLPRPGFTYTNRIVYTNNGNQAVPSGTITFTHDAVLSINSVSQAGTTAITNGFAYNFTNLQPFETRIIYVELQVPVIPTVALGQLLTNTISIVPLSGDMIPENNTASTANVIIGSYDPNDKTESRGPQIVFSTFTPNDYLYYTIRFENTGTADAINVRITDVLDAKLDETTVRMVDANHDHVLDRVNNVLTWRFDNINLPPASEAGEAATGFVTFKVKPKAGYAIGDVIPNIASIYFDFNPAIVTEPFYSTFVTQLGVGEFENGSFACYPNPASNHVTVSLKNTSDAMAAIAVYDLLGKRILTQKASLSTETIDVATMAKGVYLLEVTTASNAKSVKKLVIQ